METSLFTVHTSTLFDPTSKQFENNISIVVNTANGAIEDVIQRGSIAAQVKPGDIDLRRKIAMPGLIDAHTHVERSSTEQMRDESIVERTLRAVNRLASHDASLQDAVNGGLKTTGPRLFVATSCLVTTGSYEIRTENYANGLRLPSICDHCDGVDGAQYLARPFFGDAILFPPMNRNPATVMFTQDEMNAIVDEARSAGLPVACHAGTTRGITMAAKAVVTSIENGTEANRSAIHAIAENGCIYVPTLALVEAVAKERLPEAQAIAREAHAIGVRLAAGGDTGAFNHGQGAREMELLIEAGIPVEDVLQACMLGGWESCGGEACGYRFGWLEKGHRADIIALDTDPRIDEKAFRKVSSVMKDAHVWKLNPIPVGFIDRIMDKAAHSDSVWELV
ncbi:hypothetical protein MY10362_007781 [Beauveria mimosiformis]